MMTPRDDAYVLNLTGPLLNRDWSVPPRHGAGRPVDGLSAWISDAWRIPWVDTHRDPSLPLATSHNDVTFVWFMPTGAPPASVEVFGTFAPLRTAFPLRPVGPRRFATTLTIPMGEVHRYRFRVDGNVQLDPINPQRTQTDDGVVWSRFFTWGTNAIVELTSVEVAILDRLTAHILPLNGPKASRFLSERYYHLERQVRKRLLPNVGRLDPTIGAVSYIDKILATAERHHRIDYTLGLGEVRQVLETRFPDTDLTSLPKDAWVEIYEQMGRGENGDVPGWRLERYGRPKFFLELLRRHTWTGAFSNPRWGGNVGATGWSWLEDRYRASDGTTLFDWARHQPPPLGRSNDYHG